MAQLFRPQANWIARTILIGLPILCFLSLALAGAFDRSQYVTDVGRALEQPVPFSHKHHVGQLGVDCRYCHTQVETGPVATLPSSEICMTCHSQIWSTSPVLEPVRESARTGRPLHWQKVTKVPGFVYFDHSIHVRKGVECARCHGDVAQMSLTRLEHPMTMEFCLNCHREPERILRHDVRKKVDCYTCHR